MLKSQVLGGEISFRPAGRGFESAPRETFGPLMQMVSEDFPLQAPRVKKNLKLQFEIEVAGTTIISRIFPNIGTDTKVCY